MAHLTPGSFVHYRPSGSNLPLWPVVVCTEDVAPKSFLRTRPAGYVTLVLRIGVPLEFRWALATDMHEYDPFLAFKEGNMVANTPGLGEANAIAESALDEGLGLDHWRTQVRNTATVTLSDSEGADAGSEDDDSNDSGYWKAIRESRKTAGLPTPSPSPFKRSERASKFSNIYTQELGHIDTRREPPTKLDPPPWPKRPHTPPSPLSDDERLPLKYRKSTHTSGRSDTLTTAQEGKKSSKFFLGSASNDLLSWDRLGKGSAVPTSDVVEEELTESKEFVLVYVGPEREERTLQKNHVWNRPYFRDMRTGILHFAINEAGTWVLSHPGLAEIEPEDFFFVAEYLESGELGHKRPEGESQVHEAFAQNISAWAAAIKLGMTDLLDHIVDKLERLAPWDMWDIMAFACHVFESSGPSLPAQQRMKDLLATDIAHNFWVYIEDDHLSASFVQRLKDLPELERVIYAKRIAVLKARLYGDQVGEDDGDDGDEDMD
ncbi:uncharacterized protein K460DRAFT_359016 [Cucurbitaria berberidis CBS 394.84]|uniref:PWWP domain-containing protein n=1 Tax=Cucurbitaria berberidis CBS 394.84 TaxID=1168544 RepID=A0A9P4GAV4_9PLEO|nr:uncharacterized protein K460DRAFT_359016 [Cucurbitaria berberidis CBS 394.84]KAF1842403.1 hypothetical protein K460DRAFT_359016 [Cucurbitaria berberidis CBS 394.84]